MDKMLRCVYAVGPYKACPSQNKNNKCDGKLSYPKLNIKEEQKKIPEVCACSKCEQNFCINCLEREHKDKNCAENRVEIKERFENLI
mmetsp:Transcript_44147/g.42881  ORF Transcript_44147/g.42881 Transcript_44147/m.42881 type:complete len:87 (-) Transcript_44147:199-459(-)